MENKFAPKLRDESVKQKIFELHRNGLNSVSISKEIGVAPLSIRNFLKKHNLELNIEYENDSVGFKITPEKEKRILDLHSNGTINAHIAKEIGVSSVTIAQFFKKRNITPNKQVFRPLIIPCSMCGEEFEPRHHKKNPIKLCSKECADKYRILCRTKYTEGDIEKVKELKTKGATVEQIQLDTGVKINKIKEITKENDLFLSKEQVTKNAWEGVLKNCPDWVEKMKECLKNPNVQKKKSASLKNFFSDPRNREKSSYLFKKFWEDLKQDPEKQQKYLQKRGISLSENRLGMTKEELQKIIIEINDRINKNGEFANEICKDYNLSPSTVFRGLKEMGFETSLKRSGSIGERQVLDFIKSIITEEEVIEKDRSALKRFELDVYIPKHRLGIEYNGLYWHSELRKKEEKHYDKYKLCQENKVQILAIFEDEWQDPLKQTLIKKMIEHRLGVSKAKKVRASSLKIVRFDKNDQFRDFFNKNHLDGHAKSSFALALINGKNEIISCMSFRKNFNGETEIARFATDFNYLVYGGFSKLLKHSPRPLVSFSNNRLSIGDVYQKNGFRFLSENKPSYWYTDFKTRVWRFKCKRINDPEILSKYPTERDQAINGIFSDELFGDDRPLYKIEDYGHKKWIIE